MFKNNGGSNSRADFFAERLRVLQEMNNIVKQQKQQQVQQNFQNLNQCMSDIETLTDDLDRITQQALLDEQSSGDGYSSETESESDVTFAFQNSRGFKG